MSKGSQQRPTDMKKFSDNYDRIYKNKVIQEDTPLVAAQKSFGINGKLTFGETVRLLEYAQEIEEELQCSS